MKTKKLLIACALGVLAATLMSTAQAVTLAGWDFSTLPGGTNNFGASPLTATTTQASETVGGLTRGSGIGTTGSGATNGWGGNDFRISASTQATAISDSEFATLSLTASAGFTLSLSDIGAYNIRRSGTGPTTGIWQYSLDGTNFTDIGSAITWGGTTTSAGNAQSSINLSGISALQNVAAGITVTLRVVTWGASGTAGTWYLNDPLDTAPDDFTINGTLTATAIPEPGTFVAGALAICALCWHQRRRLRSLL